MYPLSILAAYSAFQTVSHFYTFWVISVHYFTIDIVFYCWGNKLSHKLSGLNFFFNFTVLESESDVVSVAKIRVLSGLYSFLKALRETPCFLASGGHFHRLFGHSHCKPTKWKLPSHTVASLWPFLLPPFPLLKTRNYTRATRSSRIIFLFNRTAVYYPNSTS